MGGPQRAKGARGGVSAALPLPLLHSATNHQDGGHASQSEKPGLVGDGVCVRVKYQIDYFVSDPITSMYHAQHTSLLVSTVDPQALKGTKNALARRKKRQVNFTNHRTKNDVIIYE